MRTFLVRAYFTDRRHDYHELIFDSHKAACRFGLDWFVEDPTVWKLTVTDPVGREDVFMLDERTRQMESKQHHEVTITQDEAGVRTFCNTCDKLLGDATPWWMAQEKRQAHTLWHHGNNNVRAIA